MKEENIDYSDYGIDYGYISFKKDRKESKDIYISYSTIGRQNGRTLYGSLIEDKEKEDYYRPFLYGNMIESKLYMVDRIDEDKVKETEKILTIKQGYEIESEYNFMKAMYILSKDTKPSERLGLLIDKKSNYKDVPNKKAKYLKITEVKNNEEANNLWNKTLKLNNNIIGAVVLFNKLFEEKLINILPEQVKEINEKVYEMNKILSKKY